MVAQPTPNLPSAGPLFAISKSKGGSHYEVHDKDYDGAVLFNARVHNWKRGPTLELREGAEKQGGSIVGISALDGGGFTAQLALGDTDKTDPTALNYESMRDKHQLGFNEFEFQSDELHTDRQRRSYTWIRTSNHPAAFECRDLASGQVLAHYTSRGLFKWTRIGTFQLDIEPPTPRALHFLLLVFISWSEMENREAAVAAH